LHIINIIMISRYVLLTLASLAPFAAAHGHMSGVFIDNVYVPGPEPNSDSTGFAIREINDINPVKGATNPDLNCGHSAKLASEVVDASPGSVLKFAWVNGDNGPWVHNTGPVMTYMAPCGASGCASFNSSNAEFFKISELGQMSNGSWYMSDLNSALNATTQATIPNNLPSGEYLVRHELIALQLGMNPGGAEFYPACLQIRLGNTTTVASTSTSLPSGNETVTFPGGYSDTDPGILDPNVYNPGSSYTFPGPPLISAAVTDPSTGSASPSDVPANTSSDNGTPTSSSTASAVPTGCGYANKKKRVVKRVFRRSPLVNRSTTPVKKQVDGTHIQPEYRRSNHAQPVVRSRIMRGI
jgi:hypothetical protein